METECRNPGRSPGRSRPLCTVPQLFSSGASAGVPVWFGLLKGLRMTKPIARDPIYRRRVFNAEIIELCVRW